MKKLCLLFCLCVFLIPGLVMGAAIVKTGSQIAVAWDPVVVPTGSTVQYQMYYRTDPGGAPTTAGAAFTATQATVTFTTEGIYDVGVQAQRMISGSVIASSPISWSNDPNMVQNGGGGTFANQYWNNPPGPTNLRIPPPQTPKP
jgi:hypothetical protein